MRELLTSFVSFQVLVYIAVTKMLKFVICQFHGRNKKISFTSTPQTPDKTNLLNAFIAAGECDVNVKFKLENHDVIFQKFDKDMEMFIDIEDDNVIDNKTVLKVVFTPRVTTPEISAPAKDSSQELSATNGPVTILSLDSQSNAPQKVLEFQSFEAFNDYLDKSISQDFSSTPATELTKMMPVDCKDKITTTQFSQDKVRSYTVLC